MFSMEVEETTARQATMTSARSPGVIISDPRWVAGAGNDHHWGRADDDRFGFLSYPPPDLQPVHVLLIAKQCHVGRGAQVDLACQRS